jgi:hypothetical protein
MLKFVLKVYPEKHTLLSSWALLRNVEKIIN